jgi:hypothetical protein
MNRRSTREKSISYAESGEEEFDDNVEEEPMKMNMDILKPEIVLENAGAPRGPFETLPIELQLLILENLDVCSIFTLKATSKATRHAIVMNEVYLAKRMMQNMSKTVTFYPSTGLLFKHVPELWGPLVHVQAQALYRYKCQFCGNPPLSKQKRRRRWTVTSNGTPGFVFYEPEPPSYSPNGFGWFCCEKCLENKTITFGDKMLEDLNIQIDLRKIPSHGQRFRRSDALRLGQAQYHAKEPTRESILQAINDHEIAQDAHTEAYEAKLIKIWKEKGVEAAVKRVLMDLELGKHIKETLEHYRESQQVSAGAKDSEICEKIEDLMEWADEHNKASLEEEKQWIQELAISSLLPMKGVEAKWKRALANFRNARQTQPDLDAIEWFIENARLGTDLRKQRVWVGLKERYCGEGWSAPWTMVSRNVLSGVVVPKNREEEDALTRRVIEVLKRDPTFYISQLDVEDQAMIRNVGIPIFDIYTETTRAHEDFLSRLEEDVPLLNDLFSKVNATGADGIRAKPTLILLAKSVANDETPMTGQALMDAVTRRCDADLPFKERLVRAWCISSRVPVLRRGILLLARDVPEFCRSIDVEEMFAIEKDDDLNKDLELQHLYRLALFFMHYHSLSTQWRAIMTGPHINIDEFTKMITDEIKDTELMDVKQSSRGSFAKDFFDAGFSHDELLQRFRLWYYKKSGQDLKTRALSEARGKIVSNAKTTWDSNHFDKVAKTVTEGVDIKTEAEARSLTRDIVKAYQTTERDDSTPDADPED